MVIIEVTSLDRAGLSLWGTTWSEGHTAAKGHATPRHSHGH